MIKSPGEMNARIRIQKLVVKGAGISQSAEWIDIGNSSSAEQPKWIYAKWEEKSDGSEIVQNGNVKALQPYTVSIWYDSGIDKRCRVVDADGADYEILSVKDVFHNKQQLEMLVKAVEIA